MKEKLKFPLPRYEILKKIGRGTWGEVYKAHDVWEQRELALKLLLKGSLLKKFQGEFQLLSELQYPGLAQAFDFGYTQDKKAYFTMELVEGPTLCGIDFKQNLKKLYELALKLVAVLDYIHCQGIVHCDLKPDNIRVTKDPFGLKLLDFGLAEKLGSFTKTKPRGTLAYIAPEVLTNRKKDERADFYSLGIMLYELITGKLPFPEDDPIKLISAHVEKKPVFPSELNSSIPQKLNDLVLKLLEKSPQDRPSSSQLKKALHSLLDCKSGFEEERLFLSHLSGGKMVGREKELRSIVQKLDQATITQGKFVLIQGELGIGKSLLIKNLKIKAQLKGLLFIHSKCKGRETSPYYPIRKILSKLLPCLSEKSPSLLEEFGQELKVLLPDKSTDLTKKTPDISGEEEYLCDRVAQLLVKASKVLPLCLCLEDLHQAAQGSLKIIAKLASLLPEGRIFLCATLREQELSPEGRLGNMIDHLSGKSYFDCLKLSRFSLDELRKFLTSKLNRIDPPPELVTYVHKSTSGNPFFAIEVLKFLLEKRIISLDRKKLKIDSPALCSALIPDRLEKIWMDNLERYDESIQNFLSVSALAGKGFDLEIVKFLSGYSENKIFEILFLMLRDQVLIQSKKGKDEKLWYEFANSSLKHLLYEKLPDKKRTFLHKKLGEFLEKRKDWPTGEKAEDIAYHFVRSNDYEKAFHYSMICADKASGQFAHHETGDHLKNALEASLKHEDKTEGAQKRLSALTRRADLWKSTGELNLALKDYQENARLAKILKDLPNQAKAQRELAEIYRLKHDHKSGLDHLKQALEIYQKIEDANGIASTLNNLGNLYWIDSQYELAKESYQKALKMHEKLGNKKLAALCLNNTGIICSLQYKYAESLDYFNQSLLIQRELDNKEEVARSLNNVGAVLVLSAKYNQAIGSFVEALKLNEKMGNKKEMCFNLENLGAAFLKLGDFKSALKYGTKGLRLSKQIDFQQRIGWIEKDMGITNLELGLYQKAKRYLDRSLKISEQIRDKELKTVVITSLAKLFYLLDDLSNASVFLSETRKLIQKIDEKRSLISVNQLEGLIRARNGQRKEGLNLLSRALKKAQELGVKEEQLSLNLDLAEISLSLENMESASLYLNKARRLMDENQSKVLEPDLYFKLGKLNWKKDNRKAAERLFALAAHKASSLNRPEMVWRNNHLLAKLYLESYEIEKAYRELQKAGTVLKKISDQIKDPDLKDSYLNHEEKKELLADVRKVTQVLAGKTSPIVG
jgi:serine/threonine protein kinase/tetratricopeptide (TPR) repeat protein